MIQSTRHMPHIILGTVLVTLATMIGVIHWFARSTDTVAASNSEYLVHRAIVAEQEVLEAINLDYGHWDQAHDWIIKGQEDQIYENIGETATLGPYIEVIYIMTPDGSVTHAFQREGTESDLSAVDTALANTMALKVRALPQNPYGVTGGLSRINGRIAFVSAGRVQPWNMTGLKLEELPILLVAVYLTQDVLDGISDDLLLGPITRDGQTSNQSPQTASSSLALTDVNGNQIASLQWDAPKPGTDLLRRALPVIAVIAIMLIGGSLLTGRHVSRQSLLVETAKSQAMTDPLTGLLNRRGLNQLIDTDEIRFGLETGWLALIYLDLNGFKLLNDGAGHDLGDLALETTATRLRASVRPSDRLARLGGDEFLCVVTDRSPHTAAMRIAGEIFDSMHMEFVSGPRRFVINAAIGIAIAEPGITFDALLSQADEAMFSAKRSGVAAPLVFAQEAILTENSPSRSNKTA